MASLTFNIDELSSTSVEILGGDRCDIPTKYRKQSKSVVTYYIDFEDILLYFTQAHLEK